MDNEVSAGPSGDDGLDLAMAIEAVQERTGAEIFDAAWTGDVSRIAGKRSPAFVERIDAPTTDLPEFEPRSQRRWRNRSTPGRLTDVVLGRTSPVVPILTT